MRSPRQIRRDMLLAQAKRRIRVIPDPVLNRICTDLAEELKCKSAFCSFVGSDVAYIVGASNLSPEFLNPKGVALNASFCAQLVNSSNKQSGIVANDTRKEPMLRYCPTTAIYRSWVGAPIHYKGQLVGSIGAADDDPREWPLDALEVTFKAAAQIELEIS